MNLIENIHKLPEDLINGIREYIPKIYLVFTNRENYKKYHYIIKNYILNYETFIRNVIRRDNEYVFDLILRENYQLWCEIKQYKYKSMIFRNYFCFTINYCIEQDSNNCEIVINIFLQEHGLDKNLHKKNVVKYIRWKK
jgi:hypothetical protein